MSEDSTPYLDLEIENGVWLKLESAASADEWLNKEEATWSWLTAKQQHGAVPAVCLSFSTHFENFRNAIDRDKEKQSQKFAEKLTEAIREQTYICGETRHAQCVAKMRTEVNDRVAEFALAQFVRSPIKPGDRYEADAINGSMRAVLFDCGVTGNVQLETGELKSLRDNFLNEFTTKGSQCDQMLRDSNEQLRGTIDGCKSELARIQKDFIAINALKAPAEYWDQRRKDHTRKFRWLGAITIVPGFGALAGLVYWSLHAPSAIEKVDQVWKAIPVGIPFLLCFIATFWFVRILVRLFLSNYHLATDADERVALVKSYQALRMDPDNKLGGESLDIILRQIFRHAATGVVTEDSAPQIPIEILTRPK